MRKRIEIKSDEDDDDDGGSGRRDGGDVAPTLPHPSPHHLPATPHVTPTTLHLRLCPYYH